MYAAKVLSIIPYSDFSARMTERLLPLVALSTKNKKTILDISFPPRINKDLKADGVDLVSHAASGLATRAGYFCQMVSAVPPSTWSARFSLPAQNLIQLALDQKNRYPLILGWTIATIAHKNETWARAILHYLFRIHGLHDVIKSKHRRALMNLIPDSEMEKMYNDALGKQKIFKGDHLDYSLVLDRRKTLPASTGKRFMDKLDHSLRDPSVRIDGAFHKKLKFLSIAGLILPVSLYPEAVSRFQKSFGHQPMFRKSIEEMMTNLEFRYHLLKYI